MVLTTYPYLAQRLQITWSCTSALPLCICVGMSWGVLYLYIEYSRKIFTLQKRIIRIMMGTHQGTSCIELFKELEILTIPSQYIYLLMSFFIGNQDKFLTQFIV